MPQPLLPAAMPSDTLGTLAGGEGRHVQLAQVCVQGSRDVGLVCESAVQGETWGSCCAFLFARGAGSLLPLTMPIWSYSLHCSRDPFVYKADTSQLQGNVLAPSPLQGIPLHGISSILPCPCHGSLSSSCSRSKCLMVLNWQD